MLLGTFNFSPLIYGLLNMHLFHRLCCQKYPKIENNWFLFYRLKIHLITVPLPYQMCTTFKVIIFFRIFAFGPLNFSHFAPNIHLFCRFCCQKHPKIENTSFFILQAENSPHNWSIAVSNVHNVQSYLIFPNFCFCTVELFSPYTPC